MTTSHVIRGNKRKETRRNTSNAFPLEDISVLFDRSKLPERTDFGVLLRTSTFLPREEESLYTSNRNNHNNHNNK